MSYKLYEWSIKLARNVRPKYCSNSLRNVIDSNELATAPTQWVIVGAGGVVKSSSPFAAEHFRKVVGLR